MDLVLPTPLRFYPVCPLTSRSLARYWAMIVGGHEPRVYAAVCFWLCRGSGGHQLCCTGLSVSSAAGSLLCLYRRLTCPALLTLLTQTQQVQRVLCLYMCLNECIFTSCSYSVWLPCGCEIARHYETAH